MIFHLAAIIIVTEYKQIVFETESLKSNVKQLLVLNVETFIRLLLDSYTDVQ